MNVTVDTSLSDTVPKNTTLASCGTGQPGAMVVAADGNVVDVVVLLLVVVGAFVTTDTESSVGMAACPATDPSSNHATDTSAAEHTSDNTRR